MPRPRSDDISNASDLQHQDEAGSATGGTPLRWTAPGTLDLSIHRRGAVIELDVSGELDMATAPRLGEAMAWLRLSSAPATTIVIDTSGVEFIAAAGYRALLAVLVRPDGLWDPRVALIVGPAVARLEAAIAAGQERPVGVDRPLRVVAPQADSGDKPLASVPTPSSSSVRTPLPATGSGELDR